MLCRQKILKMLREKAIVEKKAEIQQSKMMLLWAKHVKCRIFIAHMVYCKNTRVLQYVKSLKADWTIFHFKNRFRTHCMRRVNREISIAGYKQMIVKEKKYAGEYGYQMDEEWSMDALPFADKFVVINTFLCKQRTRMAITLIAPGVCHQYKIRAAEKIRKFLTNLKDSKQIRLVFQNFLDRVETIQERARLQI